jgi:hypothetical protein
MRINLLFNEFSVLEY